MWKKIIRKDLDAGGKKTDLWKRDWFRESWGQWLSMTEAWVNHSTYRSLTGSYSIRHDWKWTGLEMEFIWPLIYPSVSSKYISLLTDWRNCRVCQRNLLVRKKFAKYLCSAHVPYFVTSILLFYVLPDFLVPDFSKFNLMLGQMIALILYLGLQNVHGVGGSTWQHTMKLAQHTYSYLFSVHPWLIICQFTDMRK